MHGLAFYWGVSVVYFSSSKNLNSTAVRRPYSRKHCNKNDPPVHGRLHPRNSQWSHWGCGRGSNQYLPVLAFSRASRIPSAVAVTRLVAVALFGWCACPVCLSIKHAPDQTGTRCNLVAGRENLGRAGQVLSPPPWQRTILGQLSCKVLGPMSQLYFEQIPRTSR